MVAMRYEKGRKEATRQRIIEVASLEFRKHGIAASGLAGIMENAGLTIGAFYPNFSSKADLITETLAYIMGVQLERMKDIVEGDGGLVAGILDYLDKDHVNNPQRGCPSAALLPEIAREANQTRVAYQEGMLPFIELLAEHMPKIGTKSPTTRAFALFGLLVGTLQIARAIPDRSLAENILNEGIEAAKQLAGLTHADATAGRSSKTRKKSRSRGSA